MQVSKFFGKIVCFECEMKSIVLTVLFASVVCSINYCYKNKEHPFCRVDCLRSPELCHKGVHIPLSLTTKQIKEMEKSLNFLRQQAADQNLSFHTKQTLISSEIIQHKLTKKPFYMNSIVN